MPVSPLALGEALAEAVGSDHVRSDAATLAAGAIDGVAPRWVVHPATTEEMSRVVAVAAAEGLAVSPRGSGSHLGLGHPPRRLDVVLDCRRLDGLLDYVPEDMVASVGAGMTLRALGARLERHRQRLPVDPPGGESRTVGGVLATGATGPLRFRYGGPRDLLLGVRFVQADGTVTWGGSRVVKSVSGYDVPKLLVGSLGTLGIIAEATVRLHPIPPAAGSWLLRSESTEGMTALLGALVLSTLEPDRLALLSRAALAALGLPVTRLAVAVSIASVAEAVASQGEALARLGREHGAESSPLAAEFWPRLSRALDAPVLVKLAGEPARLVAWLERIEREVSTAGLTISAVGEARSGVIYAALAGPLTGPALTRLVEPLREGLAPESGSLVIERVPAPLKPACDVWGPLPPGALAIMRRLKQELDPGGVLNPGRFVGRL
jgi:glycolate dehydrogenase FAD-binding subunit